MPSKELAIKHSTILATYLLVVWGFYRFLFRLPEEVEETIVKPIIWLVPVVWLVKKEKLGISSLGITTKNLFPSLYLSLGLGSLFAIEGVLINFVKHEGFSFNANIGQVALFTALGLSFATAVSEEIAFRGYLFNRVSYALGKEFQANVLTSLVWGLVHVPISIFWLELSLAGVIGFFILTTIFGMGSAFVFSRTKNVFSSILLHVLWSWPIILFR